VLQPQRHLQGAAAACWAPPRATGAAVGGCTSGRPAGQRAERGGCSLRCHPAELVYLVDLRWRNRLLPGAARQRPSRPRVTAPPQAAGAPDAAGRPRSPQPTAGGSAAPDLPGFPAVVPDLGGPLHAEAAGGPAGGEPSRRVPGEPEGGLGRRRPHRGGGGHGHLGDPQSQTLGRRVPGGRAGGPGRGRRRRARGDGQLGDPQSQSAVISLCASLVREVARNCIIIRNFHRHCEISIATAKRGAIPAPVHFE
jgi:hypothetical protein